MRWIGLGILLSAFFIFLRRSKESAAAKTAKGKMQKAKYAASFCGYCRISS
jgi:hypothetical protein